MGGVQHLEPHEVPRLEDRKFLHELPLLRDVVRHADPVELGQGQHGRLHVRLVQEQGAARRVEGAEPAGGEVLQHEHALAGVGRGGAEHEARGGEVAKDGLAGLAAGAEEGVQGGKDISGRGMIFFF